MTKDGRIISDVQTTGPDSNAIKTKDFRGRTQSVGVLLERRHLKTSVIAEVSEIVSKVVLISTTPSVGDKVIFWCSGFCP